MIAFYRGYAPPVVALHCDIPGCKEYLAWTMAWNPNPDGMRIFALMCGWTQPKQGEDICQDHSISAEEKVNGQPQPA